MCDMFLILNGTSFTGYTDDNTLIIKFTHHIEQICKNASRKLNALARLASYMGKSKRRTLMNAF